MKPESEDRKPESGTAAQRRLDNIGARSHLATAIWFIRLANRLWPFVHCAGLVETLEQLQGKIERELRENHASGGMRLMPKYYIASKTKHAPAWLINRANGDQITSTWIDEAGVGQTADHSDLACRCVKEIAQADFLVLYCEPGEVQKGATIEAGIALGMGKEVRCVGTCETTSKTFIKHPLWREFPSVKAAVDEGVPALQFSTAEEPVRPTSGAPR